VPIGDVRADVDAIRAVLDRLAGSYRTGSQQVRDAAATLSHSGKDSNRPELSDAVSVGQLATEKADRTATIVAEAGRQCFTYAWQL
jgi:hypothetical protein